MISCCSVSKHFGSVAAVRELDLEVRAGETLALVGPNGSGKTTTLKSILGLVVPNSGRITVGGVDVSIDGGGARRKMGYLPQRLCFPEGCTAIEVMQLYAKLRGSDIKEIAALLERTGLQDSGDRVIDGFSGGMRQRLGLAIALLGNPDVLVLDEPSAALDPTGALMVRDILHGISLEGRTVLLSSHDLSEVQSLADRVAIFVGGCLAAVGTMAELSEAFCQGYSGHHSQLSQGKHCGVASAGTGENQLESLYRTITGNWRPS